MTSTSNYWGKRPFYSRVEIENIPSFATQQLKLRSGELDVMTHGILARDITAFSKDPKFKVVRLPGIAATNLWINSNKPNLKRLAVRRAVAMALDRQALVRQVYGENSVVNTGFFAPGSLPPRYGGQFKTKYNPTAAKQVVEGLSDDQRRLNFVYTTDDAANQQLAGLIVARLNAVGFRVTLRAIPITEVFNYPTYPDSKRPDGVIVPQNPDDSSPPSFPQLVWITNPPAGTYFRPIAPNVDKLFFRAIRTAPHEKAMRLYGQAADAYGATACMIPISNNLTVTVARAGITGIAVERQGLWTVRIPQLRAG
jgi:peptide/nickel transport system substrate-binding protein